MYNKNRVKLSSSTRKESASVSKKSDKHTCCSKQAQKGRYCSDCGGKRAESSVYEDSEDESKSKMKQTDAGKSGFRNWTKQQDEKIKQMKCENKWSWNEIGMKVGASKKEVQHRFKELQMIDHAGRKASAEYDSEKSQPDGLGIHGVEAVDTGDLDFTNLFLEDDSGVEGGASGNDAPFSTLTGYEGYKKKTKKGEKKKNKQASSPRIKDAGGDWYEIQKGEGFEEQHRAGHLKVDDFWTQDYCDVLEALEARHRENKWLHIQADFFNLTQQHVDASIIAQKFKDDGLI
jgi:hypothetical protein